MKVTGPNRVRSGPAQRVGKAQPSGDGGFARHIPAGTDASVGAVAGTTNIGSVEALLALQETSDATQRRGSAAFQRAEDLLDRLDDIRVGLLLGRFSKARLERLVARLEERRAEAGDPRMASLLDEIELRAKVELAKLSII